MDIIPSARVFWGIQNNLNLGCWGALDRVSQLMAFRHRKFLNRYTLKHWNVRLWFWTISGRSYGNATGVSFLRTYSFGIFDGLADSRSTDSQTDLRLDGILTYSVCWRNVCFARVLQAKKASAWVITHDYYILRIEKDNLWIDLGLLSRISAWPLCHSSVESLCIACGLMLLGCAFRVICFNDSPEMRGVDWLCVGCICSWVMDDCWRKAIRGLWDISRWRNVDGGWDDCRVRWYLRGENSCFHGGAAAAAH